MKTIKFFLRGGESMKKKVFAAVAISILAVSVASVPAFAAQNDNTRPGWGHGDNNHVHTGPPGHSVRPPFEERFTMTIQRVITRLQRLDDRIENPKVSNSLQNLISRLTSWIS